MIVGFFMGVAAMVVAMVVITFWLVIKADDYVDRWGEEVEKANENSRVE